MSSPTWRSPVTIDHGDKLLAFKNYLCRANMVEFCDFHVEPLKSSRPSCFSRLLRRVSHRIRSLSSWNTTALSLKLENLPDDILIYNIVERIDRTDILCLALTSKLLGERLIDYLRRTWKPVTIQQRLAFLR